MKEFLSRAGQTFTERVVDEDEAAYNELIAMGYRAVPVTVIGGEEIRGFDPGALSKALASAD